MKPYTKSRDAKKIKIGKFYIIVTFAFIICTLISLYADAVKIMQLKNERMEIQALIEQEEQRQKDINSQKLYYESDSYIEKLAREKLGLVKSNDIIYIDRNSN